MNAYASHADLLLSHKSLKNFRFAARNQLMNYRCNLHAKNQKLVSKYKCRCHPQEIDKVMVVLTSAP